MENDQTDAMEAAPLPAKGGVYDYVDGVLVPLDGGPVVDGTTEETLGEDA
jgi:hypothetical protein